MWFFLLLFFPGVVPEILRVGGGKHGGVWYHFVTVHFCWLLAAHNYLSLFSVWGLVTKKLAVWASVGFSGGVLPWLPRKPGNMEPPGVSESS